jgi:hypothetical protein
MSNWLKGYFVVAILSGIGLSVLTNQVISSLYVRTVVGFLLGVGLALLPIPSRIGIEEFARPIAAVASAMFALAIVIFDVSAGRFDFNSVLLAGAISAGIYFAIVSEL